MAFNNPLSFEMYSYNNNPSAFYTMQQGRIPVEYTGSSTLDERDRRRRRTGSTSSSKDKEVLPNMHLVCQFESTSLATANPSRSGDGHKTERHSEPSANARRGMSRVLSINLKICTTNTKSSSNPTHARPTKSPSSTIA